MVANAETLSRASRAEAAEPEKKSLVSPSADFFLLGGLSFLLLPIVYALPQETTLFLTSLSFFVANFVNHPHFASSYQIFYRGWRKTLGDQGASLAYRVRVLFAAVVIPVCLAGYLAFAVADRNLQLLGIAVKVMGFLVGWHYAKQGYGMLIVQSVLKRQFFSDQEKNVIRLNAYAGWLFSYLFLAYEATDSSYWGIQLLAIPVPSWLLTVLGVSFAATTLATVAVFLRRWAARKLPMAGVTAYGVTLYVWLFMAIDPKLILVVPALHSLQYLTVIHRYETNYQRERGEVSDSAIGMFGRTPLARTVGFFFTAGVLGYVAFWMLPEFLQNSVGPDFGGDGKNPAIYMAAFWIFINLHHYFIDTVLWRKDNKETARYVFA